jgi:hypothetical protein
MHAYIVLFLSIGGVLDHAYGECVVVFYFTQGQNFVSSRLAWSIPVDECWWGYIWTLIEGFPILFVCGAYYLRYVFEI